MRFETTGDMIGAMVANCPKAGTRDHDAMVLHPRQASTMPIHTIAEHNREVAAPALAKLLKALPKHGGKR